MTKVTLSTGETALFFTLVFTVGLGSLFVGAWAGLSDTAEGLLYVGAALLIFLAAYLLQRRVGARWVERMEPHGFRRVQKRLVWNQVLPIVRGERDGREVFLFHRYDNREGLPAAAAAAPGLPRDFDMDVWPRDGVDEVLERVAGRFMLGDAALDAAFSVHVADEDLARRILTDPALRGRLLAWRHDGFAWLRAREGRILCSAGSDRGLGYHLELLDLAMVAARAAQAAVERGPAAQASPPRA